MGYFYQSATAKICTRVWTSHSNKLLRFFFAEKDLTEAMLREIARELGHDGGRVDYQGESIDFGPEFARQSVEEAVLAFQIRNDTGIKEEAPTCQMRRGE